MKAWKYLAILLVLLIISGCSVSQKLVKENQNKVMGAYLDAMSSARNDSAEFIRQNLKVNKSFGYVKPYVPVVEPAEVRLVWFPAHKSKYDPNTLVSGHWVYIMLHEARWFIDSQDKEKGKIRVLIPYKEGDKK